MFQGNRGRLVSLSVLIFKLSVQFSTTDLAVRWNSNYKVEQGSYDGNYTYDILAVRRKRIQGCASPDDDDDDDDTLKVNPINVLCLPLVVKVGDTFLPNG